MKMLPLLLLGATCSASLSVGCVLGCDPANVGAQTPVQYTPATTEAVRTPESCASSATVFGQNDSFTLALQGSAAVSLTVPASVDVGQSIPLVVTPGSTSTTAQSSDGSIHFTFTPGSGFGDTSEITSVIVTVSSVPAADGQSLAAELEVHFEDRGLLDQSYSAPVQTNVLAGCDSAPAARIQQ